MDLKRLPLHPSHTKFQRNTFHNIGEIQLEISKPLPASDMEGNNFWWDEQNHPNYGGGNNVLLEASASVGSRRNSQSWVGFENATRGKVNKWRWIPISEAKNRKGHFFWLGSSVNCRGFPNPVIAKIIRLVTINKYKVGKLPCFGGNFHILGK